MVNVTGKIHGTYINGKINLKLRYRLLYIIVIFLGSINIYGYNIFKAEKTMQKSCCSKLRLNFEKQEGEECIKCNNWWELARGVAIRW